MRRRARAGIVTVALALAALTSCGASGTSSSGQAGPDTAAGSKSGSVALKRIGSFENPVYVTGAPGDRQLLFVVEQGGHDPVCCAGDAACAGPSSTSPGWSPSKASAACSRSPFPPDYRRSGLFYVYYTDRQGDIRVDEFRRRSRTRASRGSRRAVIEIPHPVNSNHNGGQLQFLGDLLYLGTGDGGSAGDPPNNAQNRESLLGKLLRIDPRRSGGRPYTAPASNPFVGRPGRDEIYSYGLRNPFRFSFDTVTAATPRIAIGDVGQNRVEEIDYTTVAAASGANFGWDAFEGFGPLPRRGQRNARPGRHGEADLRLRRIAAEAARSPAATSSPTAASGASTGATSTPTTAMARCAAWCPT